MENKRERELELRSDRGRVLEMHKLTGSHERPGGRIKENFKGTISMHLYLHTGVCTHTHHAVAVYICSTDTTALSCLLDGIPGREKRGEKNKTPARVGEIKEHNLAQCHVCFK